MSQTETVAQERRPRRRVSAGAAQDLLRQTQQLTEQMAVFDRSARKILKWLDPRIPAPEVEAMITPEANLLGTLECLLADDLAPALEKLLELDGLLTKTDPMAASATVSHGPQAACTA